VTRVTAFAVVAGFGATLGLAGPALAVAARPRAPTRITDVRLHSLPQELSGEVRDERSRVFRRVRTWTRPGEAIRAARARELFLLPPTAACLAGLAGYPDVAAALGAEHSMRPVIPAVVQVDGTFWLTVPEDVGYPL